MKKIRYLALAVCLLYVCFFTGCMFIDSVPAFEDRTYRKIEQAEVDAALDELRSISQPGKTAKDFIRAFRKAESLLKELETYRSMLYVARLRDANNEDIKTERNRVASLHSQFFSEFKNSELELLASPAKALMIEAFGESYTNRLSNNFFYADDEHYALKEEEDRLEDQYDSLSEQGDAQGMIDLYVDLIRLRNKIANKHGFDTYPEYYYASNYERDYTVDQIEQLREYAKKWLAPLYDDTLGYDGSLIDAALSEEDLMSLLDKTMELLGEKNLQNSLRHLKEKNLYEYSISPANATSLSLYLMPAYGDSLMYMRAPGTLYSFTDLMRVYGRYTAVYLGENSLYSFGRVTDLSEAFSRSMYALTLPLYSQLFGEEYATALKAYNANDYAWVMLSNLAFDAFERFAYSLDEETLNSPDIGDILNEEYKRIFTELNIYTENRRFYTTYHFYTYPSYFITFAISRLTAIQFTQPTINGVPSAEMYAEFAKYGEYDLFMSVINRAGLNSPFDEATVKSAAEVIIRLLQESGRPVDLSDWPAA